MQQPDHPSPRATRLVPEARASRRLGLERSHRAEDQQYRECLNDRVHDDDRGGGPEAERPVQDVTTLRPRGPGLVHRAAVGQAVEASGRLEGRVEPRQAALEGAADLERRSSPQPQTDGRPPRSLVNRFDHVHPRLAADPGRTLPIEIGPRGVKQLSLIAIAVGTSSLVALIYQLARFRP